MIAVMSRFRGVIPKIEHLFAFSTSTPMSRYYAIHENEIYRHSGNHAFRDLLSKLSLDQIDLFRSQPCNDMSKISIKIE